jgi:hypothetical protein
MLLRACHCRTSLYTVRVLKIFSALLKVLFLTIAGGAIGGIILGISSALILAPLGGYGFLYAFVKMIAGGILGATWANAWYFASDKHSTIPTHLLLYGSLLPYILELSYFAWIFSSPNAVGGPFNIEGLIGNLPQLFFIYRLLSWRRTILLHRKRLNSGMRQ